MITCLLWKQRIMFYSCPKLELYILFFTLVHSYDSRISNGKCARKQIHAFNPLSLSDDCSNKRHSTRLTKKKKITNGPDVSLTIKIYYYSMRGSFAKRGTELMLYIHTTAVSNFSFIFISLSLLCSTRKNYYDHFAPGYIYGAWIISSSFPIFNVK